MIQFFCLEGKIAPHPGTPKSDVTPENIDKVHDIILFDTLVNVRKLAEAISISIGFVSCPQGVDSMRYRN